MCIIKDRSVKEVRNENQWKIAGGKYWFACCTADCTACGIRDTYKEIKNLHRDAFYYITYVGEDADNYVWFNDKGKAIVSRKKDTDQTDKVKQEVQKRYGAKDIQVALGYGYDNPVYAVECSAGQILLDYDSLKEVYFLKKGEA